MKRIDLGITHRMGYLRWRADKESIYQLNQEVNSGEVRGVAKSLVDTVKSAVSKINKYAALKRYEARGKRLHFYVEASYHDTKVEFDFFADEYWDYDGRGTVYCCYSSFEDYIISKIAEELKTPMFAVAFYIPKLKNNEYQLHAIWAGEYKNVRSYDFVSFDKVLKLDVATNNIIASFFNGYNQISSKFEPVKLDDPYALEHITFHPNGHLRYNSGLVYSKNLTQFLIESPIRVQLIIGRGYVLKYLNSDTKIGTWRGFKIDDIPQAKIKELMFNNENAEYEIERLLRSGDTITTKEIKAYGFEPGKIIPKLRKKIGPINKDRLPDGTYVYYLKKE